MRDSIGLLIKSIQCQSGRSDAIALLPINLFEAVRRLLRPHKKSNQPLHIGVKSAPNFSFLFFINSCSRRRKWFSRSDLLKGEGSATGATVLWSRLHTHADWEKIRRRDGSSTPNRKKTLFLLFVLLLGNKKSCARENKRRPAVAHCWKMTPLSPLFCRLQLWRR